MPRRHDCMYAIHNVEAQAKEYLAGLKYMNYGLYVSNMDVPGNAVELTRDTYFFPQPWEAYDSVVFRWGTDLLPHEIEANKPVNAFRGESRVINYVGCTAGEWGGVLRPFASACVEKGVAFMTHSGVPADEHIRLVKSSRMAPAINIPYQSEVGYIPCRIFKNISYGQYPVTNNPHAKDFFGDVIFDLDARRLFLTAETFLPFIEVSRLHKLMDEVAKNHTYLNKLDALLAAAKISQEAR